jgi:hypothetical protein
MVVGPNRFSGFDRPSKTAEAVGSHSGSQITPLKRNAVKI